MGILAIALSASTAAAQEVPIVYVRCPRTTQTLELEGEVTVDGTTRTTRRTMRGLDVYDVLPDVINFYGSFTAPCDLVLRDAGGAERVLYDCVSSSTTEDACAAMDPAVSFDGRTIAFSVFRGSLSALSENVSRRVLDPAHEGGGSLGRVQLPNRILRTEEAQLHLVDVATGEVTALPYVPGRFDSGPAWLSDGRLAFTSDRSQVGITRVPGATTGGRLASQIWTVDPDGRNLEHSSPHSLSGDQHPLQLVDGRVAYASWQLFGARPFSADNGTPGSFGTIGNQWALMVQNPDGAHVFALYGMHTGGSSVLPFLLQDGTPSRQTLPSTIATHFLAQTYDGRVWSADYYRGNNSGLGNVFGFPPPPEGQEGYGFDDVPRNASGQPNRGDLYRPRGQVALTLWATHADQTSSVMPAPAFHTPGYESDFVWAGKLGHPAALPPRDERDPGLMVVWGKGACSTNTFNGVRPGVPVTGGMGSGTAMNLVTSLGPGDDNPGCDTGIYRVALAPVMHPSELEPIVDSPDFHEFMARAVVPYRDIFGVDAPATRPRADLAASHSALEVGTPFALLGAASTLFRETAPFGGIHFAGKGQWASQGTDTVEWEDEELCGMRFLAILPNAEGTTGALRTMAGERVQVLGEIPVRNPGVTDARGQPDTSFMVRFPAAVPYMMQAIDCEGRTLNSDQVWQSMRPGERKTCGGCHVHGQEALDFETSHAALAAYDIRRLGEGSVPLFAGAASAGTPRITEVPGYALAVSYERDIAPIFERRCVSCHGAESPAAGLSLARNTPPPSTTTNGRYPEWTYWCLVRDRSQSCVPPELRHDTAERGDVFERPQLTRYLRFMNARGSLLYWKAANARTDNRTDIQFGPGDGADHDIDFGVAHPTDIDPDELRTLARWIDTGCMGGTGSLLDTLPPTLHLAASVEGGAVTALHVGTVDVPSGIDTATLEVCVLASDGSCGPDLAGDAESHGVLVIPLTEPLTDLDTEVRARVADLEGNITELRRTVRYLMDSPPPPPAAPDAGGLDGGSHVDGGARRDGGAEPAEEPPTGCGCVVAQRRVPGAAVWALLLGWLFVCARRRR